LWKIKTPKPIDPKAVDFFTYVHQKSVKSGQIIPLFTLVWDDESESRSEKTKVGLHTRPAFLVSLCLSKNLARFHDETTTSDHVSDTGNQFNIAAGADEHHNSQEDHTDKEACYKEGACRDSDRTPDPGAP
jgi:hypothetical protein